MGRRLSDRGAMLRESIGLVLGEAKYPLSNSEIAQNPLIAELGYTPNDVSMTLVKMYQSATRPFPLKRVPGYAGSKWAYYNPEVVRVLEDKPRQQKPAAPEPPLPLPTPPQFEFNPIELPQELGASEPTVTVPPGVKAITIRIGGVSIQVELDGLTGAR